MEVIEGKLFILYEDLTKASLWGPKEEDHLITFLSYMSILRTPNKESYGDLSMLISHCLRLKGLVSDEDYFENFDPSRSFSEWLSVMNGLDSDHQVKAALHEILLKTARYQMQHGMDENNVLAAFNDLNMTQGIREQVQNQQHQAASKIQNAWRLFNQQRQDEYEVINPQRPGFLARIFSHRSTESSEAPSSRETTSWWSKITGK